MATVNITATFLGLVRLLDQELIPRLVDLLVMIGYWYDNVVCLSVHLSVTSALWLNDTPHSKRV